MFMGASVKGVERVAHEHSHAQAGIGQAGSASERYRRSLLAALLITACFTVLQFVVAFTTSSLALLSDAAHMLTDVIGLLMALGAILLARRSVPTYRRTFGMYRAEVLAALGNAVLLFGVAGYVVFEAVQRLSDPPEVPGLPVLIVAAVGLVANVVSFALLRSGARESLNVRGAYLEVLSDMIGSIGVLLSGVITLTTGWRYADPLIGVAIGLFVLPRTYVLARRALRILFQHAPKGIDVARISVELTEVPGVRDVHDLHIWTLTSGMEVASAHLTVEPDSDTSRVLAHAQDLLSSGYRIEHATLQLEHQESARRCEERSW